MTPVDFLGVKNKNNARTSLPSARTEGVVSVEKALERRRSVRSFRSSGLSLSEVSQVLWAAQGITGRDGERTVPSAGALYPLELYLVAENVRGLDPGVHHYDERSHDLDRVESGHFLDRLARSTFYQEFVEQAPAAVVIGAVYSRTTEKYGQQGRRYVRIEVGHVSQNVYLQATAAELGTVMIGSFDGGSVQKLLQLPGRLRPEAILPIGRPEVNSPRPGDLV